MDEDYDPLAELRAADDSAELHRVLLIHPPGGNGHPREAVELFSGMHSSDARGAVDTAVLLFTSWRWRRVMSRLVPEIVGTELLDQGDLDTLADRTFWPDTPSFDHPLSWFGLQLDPATGRFLSMGRTEDRIVRSRLSKPTAPVLRWAAGHLLARGRATLEQVMERADRLSAHSKGVVMAGVLDVYQRLEPAVARDVLDHALASGSGPVRRQALSLLAERDGWQAALDRAQRDPDASVRRWAERHGEASQTLF